MSSNESPQVKNYSPRFSGENETDYEAMASEKSSDESFERRLDSLADILLDELDKNLDLAVNEAAWLLYQNLKSEEADEELLECGREGGGEHRAEQSDGSLF